jgi:hypothetical protein
MSETQPPSDTIPCPVAAPAEDSLASFDGLKAAYLSQVEMLARDGDVYPQPAIFVNQDDTVEMAMQMFDGNGVFDNVRDHVRAGAKGYAFGFDRMTAPDQGTVRSSVVTWAVVFGDRVEVGIVDYDAGGTVEEPSTTASEYWNAKMLDVVLDAQDKKPGAAR